MRKNCIMYFLIILFLPGISQSVERYQIVDIGVLGSDESRAIAINDIGHVLGKAKFNDKWEIFLWHKDSGLKIINLPQDCHVVLNNNGQIAGAYSGGLFLWDSKTGLYGIGTFGKSISIKGFNDKCQILLENEMDTTAPCNAQIYLWDNGDVFNISKDFQEQFPDYSSYLQAIAMNNKGQVILTGMSIQKKDVSKSFMWFQGKVTLLFREYDSNTRVTVSCLDDYGNMCVSIHGGHRERDDENREDGKTYFINHAKNIKAEIYNPRHLIIRNGIPQIMYCSPSEIRKRFDGVFYYLPGAEISKLIEPCYPYWLHYIRICGQNAKGWVVGHCDTVYLRDRQAFLAIPIKDILEHDGTRKCTSEILDKEDIFL